MKPNFDRGASVFDPPPLTAEQQRIKAEFEARFNAKLLEHEDHRWTNLGRCVWCVTCNERLFQGRIEPTHPNYVEPGSRAAEPKETTDMRARWGKD